MTVGGRNGTVITITHIMGITQEVVMAAMVVDDPITIQTFELILILTMI